MKSVIFLLVACFGFTSAIASELHEQRVEELFEVVDLGGLIDNTQESVLQAQLRTNPCLAIYETVIRDFYREELSWKVLKEKIKPLYLKEFSEEDLAQMIAFYKTPIGQKALKVTPALMAESVSLAGDLAEKNQEKLAVRIDAARTELGPENIPEECRKK